LVGALPNEVIATGSTTSNLHQLVACFYKPSGKRTKILADALAFPTDIYVLKSQLALHGLDPAEHLIVAGDADHPTLNEDALIDAMTDEVALVLLPSILYRSGQLLDLARLTEAAHAAGAVIGFDLCHSVGAVPHALHNWSVDFAVWCHYKYLNSGPGASGGLFVHERHHGKVTPGLQGWFGSDKLKQFDMEHDYTQGEGAAAFQMGTPHIFSLAPLVGSLELLHEAGIERIREKSLQQTNYLLALIDQELQGFGFEVSTPREEARRGGHVSLEHPEAARICKALKAEGVIPDFRAPNGIRLAPIALYTRYQDIWQMVMKLKTIMATEAYKKFENTRDVVA
ncbi:MAG TPA: kynureninase, partial [Sporolactobacillaceae bacterium]|nr:kynureninase [Sporolactobacillaceae bacterium]